MTNFGFLQTALVLDDRLKEPSRSPIAEAASLGAEEPEFGEPLDAGESGQASADRTDGGAADEFAEENLDGTWLDERAVIDGFADVGIACAVLKADPTNQETEARVIGLARRTDVVVLDWLLAEPRDLTVENGPAPGPTTSMGLIEQIVADDLARGGRLRLIAVYTSTPVLTDVASEVQRRLIESFGSALGPPIPSQGGTAFTAGGVRVVVLAKAGGSANVAEAVGASDLAVRIVSEFEEAFGGGLLPSLALHAVSTIREYTHKLLLRFERRLDPPMISQRVLTGPVAFEEFARGLVADELASVLAAGTVESAVRDEAVRREVDRLMAPDSHRRFLLTSRNGKGLREIALNDAVSILRDDHGTVRQVTLDGSSYRIEAPSVTSLMCAATDRDEVLAEAFGLDDRSAALSCLARSADQDGPDLPPPSLHLGSLVADDAEDYWICLQPLCDSVRIDGKRHFPMLRLGVVPQDQPRFDLVVLDGEPKKLSRTGTRFADIVMVRFAGDAESGRVTAQWDDATAVWTFDVAERPSGWSSDQLRWVGELRSVKAIQLAASIATNVGRIGLDESEYLRVRSTSADG